jgi:hypothetical protein
MSLELANTMGTLLTAAIVAATAIAALVQLRHLRAGNQINAMLSIGNQYESEAFREAMKTVNHQSAALEDPLFSRLRRRSRARAAAAIRARRVRAAA